MKKRKLIFGILIGSLLGLSGLNKVNALPGIGGTIIKDCKYTVCVSNCFSFGVDLEKVPISLEGGGDYVVFGGTERSCGDHFNYCSWDLSCS